MRVRDELPGLFADEQFVSAFGVRGKPGISPGLLALVTVLQFAENLTDRQAADAVLARIDWKYALGLDLSDPGFDHTVLTGFRQRLIDHELEEKVLDLLLARCSELGLVKPKGRQRTDSTHVLAAVRSANRLEFLAETLRAALEALAAAAPDWLTIRIDADWVRRYGARMDSYRLPDREPKRSAMVNQVGVDGFWLLEAVHAADATAWLREIPAVVTLRAVWLTQYHRTITGSRLEVAWREEKDLPPSRQRICSPYDTGARYATKRGSGWEGYKIHLSETCDDVTVTGLPHLVANVTTTDATVTDVEILEQIHTDLDRRNLLPGEHIVDAGYTSADLMVTAQQDFGITLLGPLRIDNSPQARAGGGFDRAAFTVDWERQQVTCPQGVQNTIWSTCTERGRESIVVRFPATACQSCPVRPQCTRSTRAGRQLMLRPKTFTTRSSTPEPSRQLTSGNNATRPGSASRAPSTKQLLSPGSVAAATSACPRHDSPMSSPRNRIGQQSPTGAAPLRRARLVGPPNKEAHPRRVRLFVVPEGVDHQHKTDQLGLDYLGRSG